MKAITKQVKTRIEKYEEYAETRILSERDFEAIYQLTQTLQFLENYKPINKI